MIKLQMMVVPLGAYQHRNVEMSGFNRNLDASDSLVSGFETIIKHDGPKVLQKIRSYTINPGNLSETDCLIESLRGNTFLTEFKSLVDRRVPDFIKLEILFTKLAVSLPICSNRMPQKK